MTDIVVQFVGKSGTQTLENPTGKSASFTYQIGDDKFKTRVNFDSNESKESRVARIIRSILKDDDLKLSDVKFMNKGSRNPVDVKFPSAIKTIIENGGTGRDLKQAIGTSAAAPSTSPSTSAAASVAAESETESESESRPMMMLGSDRVDLSAIKDDITAGIRESLVQARDNGVFEPRVLTAEISNRNKNDLLVSLFKLNSEGKLTKSSHAQIENLARDLARGEISREHASEMLVNLLQDEARIASQREKSAAPPIVGTTTRKKRIAALKAN